MKNKTYVTIGIPAYNEQGNIKTLINSLFEQKNKQVIIKNIIVATDASDDQTNNITASIAKKYNKVFLLKGNKRRGKPYRINQIFNVSNTDFVVILDADILIKSNNTIYNLIKPMIDDKSIMLTSGNPLPLAPKNFIQNIANAGYMFWDTARKNSKKTDLYYCEGPIRAFRKHLYKEMRLPPTIAEDVFPYLYCMKKGHKFKNVKGARVYYSLPSTTNDYKKQMSRAISTQKAQQNNFDINFLKKYYTIGTYEKLKALMNTFISSPIWTLLFLLLIGVPKVVSFIKPIKDSGVWNLVESTKRYE